MSQLAHPKVRHLQPVRVPSIARAAIASPGKSTLVSTLEGQAMGPQDPYVAAIQLAQRELTAIREIALPALLAIRRRKDVAPLERQIDLARAAMTVRYLLMSANKHVDALDVSAVAGDAKAQPLRERLDVLARRALQLGAYADAETMIPQRYIGDRPNQPMNPRAAETKPSHEQPSAEATDRDFVRNTDERWPIGRPCTIQDPSSSFRNRNRSRGCSMLHRSASPRVRGATGSS